MAERSQAVISIALLGEKEARCYDLLFMQIYTLSKQLTGKKVKVP